MKKIFFCGGRGRAIKKPELTHPGRDLSLD